MHLSPFSSPYTNRDAFGVAFVGPEVGPEALQRVRRYYGGTILCAAPYSFAYFSRTELDCESLGSGTLVDSRPTESHGTVAVDMAALTSKDEPRTAEYAGGMTLLEWFLRIIAGD